MVWDAASTQRQKWIRLLSALSDGNCIPEETKKPVTLSPGYLFLCPQRGTIYTDNIKEERV
jgi:hypothetical protein